MSKMGICVKEVYCRLLLHSINKILWRSQTCCLLSASHSQHSKYRMFLVQTFKAVHMGLELFAYNLQTLQYGMQFGGYT